MNLIETIFGNLFNRANIFTFRLVAFAHYLLASLTTHNNANVYDNYISLLGQKLGDVEKEMDEIDLTLAVQLAKTGTVDDLVDDFEEYMSNAYVDIVFKTKSTPEALNEFYPRGKSEYNNLLRSEAPIIMQRISDLGKKHQALIGVDMKDRMGSFVTLYDAARDLQVKQMTMVNVNRSEKNAARPALELILTEIVHEIARRHPGDVAACKGYVRWNLLYAPGTRRNTGEDDTPATPK